MSAAIELLTTELASLQRRIAANDLDVITERAKCDSRIAEVEANTATLQPRIAELEAAIALLSAPPPVPVLVHYDDLLTEDGLKPGIVAETTDAAGNVHRSAPLFDAVPVADVPESKRSSKRPSKAPVSLSTGPEQPVVDADAEAGK